MSAFIPKQYKKDPITIRMSKDKLEAVDSAASAFGMSRNEFLNQCIDYALKHMVDTKEQKEPKA